MAEACAGPASTLAFGVLALNRIEAEIDPRNLASAKSLERLGFAREGLLRERWIVRGENRTRRSTACSALHGGYAARDAQRWASRGAPAAASEEAAEKRGRFLGDAADLVGRLAIELEVELGLGPAVVPVGIRLELAASQAALHQRRALDRDVRGARRASVPTRASWVWRAGGSRARQFAEALFAFVLAREDVDLVARRREICLPPYIVGCLRKSNRVAFGSATSSLMP